MPEFHADGTPLLVFFVEGMVNSRLAGAVSRAVRAMDLGAKVRTDPVTQRLDVEPGFSDADDIIELLRVAGFAATLAASQAESAFAWLDSRQSAGAQSDGAASAKVIVEFNVTPIGNFDADRFADATGSIKVAPPLFLGGQEP
jgi:hypothetical protein